jgi:hypothetical protein
LAQVDGERVVTETKTAKSRPITEHRKDGILAMIRSMSASTFELNPVDVPGKSATGQEVVGDAGRSDLAAGANHPRMLWLGFGNRTVLSNLAPQRGSPLPGTPARVPS